MLIKMPSSDDYRDGTNPLFVPIIYRSRWATEPIEKYVRQVVPDIIARMSAIDQQSVMQYNGVIITGLDASRAFIVAPIKKNYKTNCQVNIDTVSTNVKMALGRLSTNRLDIHREHCLMAGFTMAQYDELLRYFELAGVEVYEYIV